MNGFSSESLKNHPLLGRGVERCMRRGRERYQGGDSGACMRRDTRGGIRGGLKRALKIGIRGSSRRCIKRGISGCMRRGMGRIVNLCDL